MEIMDINNKISANGFSIIPNIYNDEEIEQILEVINQVDTSKDTFRKSADLFAIRQFLKEVPAVHDLIFNEKLKAIIQSTFGDNYFVVKSIYFDKPEQSNWFVAYHQDLTISVDKKIELENFGPWTVKQNQFAVQPPIDILQHNFTIRIHLDHTDENNGALKIIPKSHLKGIYRPETIDWTIERETICRIEKGGLMIMKPLLLHSSSKTTNNNKRRVIHIEFSNVELPNELQWAERI
ncbi:phytanoyl-CoA dioxygenase [Pedobacter frigiditerrae]|uniref:Phytanoyl-CoA dioxygenase n=2 Tax=Pedobacter frigiditerrae TaxID=2530452 RepID=A0A4R0MXY1_9SPHI|nr:phytanoyl-CoA dioxygenase [Pedobacter frigiditerrae]